MYYLLIRNGTLHTIIPSEDPAFPGVEIGQRYTQDFLSRCIVRNDVDALHTGMLYDAATDSFSEPPVDDISETITEPSFEPTPQDDTDAMLVDLVYRMTLMELGVTEGV